MHMADALISPAVGGTMWAVSVGLAAHSARRIRAEVAERKAPLMGVLGAFVFAAQMLNFAIPGTGSSGHLGGGMILAILLGPHAAFLVMFSILAVQALFFADGGLLALGCNVFNLGFWPSFVAYPLLFRKMVGGKPGKGRILVASLIASVVALQLGAFGVVVQTRLSGISELPFGTFLLFMQPIHLAIGIVEGIVTAALVSFVWRARPEILEFAAQPPTAGTPSLRALVAVFAVATIVVAGVLSWFASVFPDGLEWAMLRTAGKKELESPGSAVHESLARLQEKTAILPDYGFREPSEHGAAAESASGEKEAERWPAVSGATTIAGLVGAAMVLAVTMATALLLRWAWRSR